MNVKINPQKLTGTITAPPSKSFAHRMMICAALSHGKSTIKGIQKSEDILATLDCIRALGASAYLADDTLTLGGALAKNPVRGVFPCRESGSTLRFMIPVALTLTEEAVFAASERLIIRGVKVYEELFSSRGLSIHVKDRSIEFLGQLSPGEYEIPGDISSQFASGLLMALSGLNAESRLIVTPPVESRPYIDITISVLKLFGIDIVESSPNVFDIPAGKLSGITASVEGDWSNAAFFLALKELGHPIEVMGLNEDSIQGDRSCVEMFRKIKAGEGPIDISDTPDLGPVLFAFAAACGGGEFTGTRRLRIKESDRAKAMALELDKFGIKTDVEENLVKVYPGKLSTPTDVLSAHNDHRIVMALSILSTITGGEIEGAEAVNKSFPNFFDFIETE